MKIWLLQKIRQDPSVRSVEDYDYLEELLTIWERELGSLPVMNCMICGGEILPWQKECPSCKTKKGSKK